MGGRGRQRRLWTGKLHNFRFGQQWPVPTVALRIPRPLFASFTGQFGHTYAFYSTATDNAGNTEAPHPAPDAITSLYSLPVIAAVPNQLLNAGVTLTITNSATDADAPAPTLTFSLGPDAPAGAVINMETGVLTWTPQCLQGSSSNLFEVQVSAGDNPAATNSMLFYAVVGDCVQVEAGSAVVQSGQRSCVPISLPSAVALTNLSFTLAYPPNRFANWTIAATNPAVTSAAIQPLDASHTLFRFTAKPGQPLQGPTTIGTVCFDAASGSSAFISLTVTNVSGIEADGTPAGNVLGVAGREVVEGPEPLLDAWLGTGRQPMLTLYGSPGATYEILSNTNLTSTHWQTDKTLTLTNFVEDVSVTRNSSQIYYRAVKLP